jgi:hypothetical protein
VDVANDEHRVSPLAHYYLGQFAERLGSTTKAAAARQQAMEASPEYCFPFQWEAIHVLRRAMELNPRDARAPYYLGNLLFDWQPEEAVKLWETSAALDPSFPIAHRNLAIAYAHQQPRKTSEAIAELEKAVAAPVKYARHFTELDELYAESGRPPQERLALLERNHATVLKRDDSLSREVGLKVVAGKYDEAIALMTGRKFSVWEGGSLDVSDHWLTAHTLRAEQKLAAGQFAAALADLEAAQRIPDNLPSDQRQLSSRNAEIAYLMGAAHEGLGELDQARKLWQEALQPASEENRGRRRGLGRLEFGRAGQRYCEGLARQKLGENEAAAAIFKELANAASGMQSEAGPEDSSPGRPRSSQRTRQAAIHFAAGLGHLGLNEKEQARAEFSEALEAAPDNPRVRAAARMAGASNP